MWNLVLIVLQPLWWRCVECVIRHDERDVREEQQYIYVARTSNKSDCGTRSLFLLAATVQSFAHMPLGFSGRNNYNISALLRFYLMDTVQCNSISNLSS